MLKRWGVALLTVAVVFISVDEICYLLLRRGFSITQLTKSSSATEDFVEKLLPYEIPHQNPSQLYHFGYTPSQPSRTLKTSFDHFDSSAPYNMPQANYSGRMYATLENNTEVYNVNLTTDSLRRRRARGTEFRNSPRHVLLLGCSQTFGEGLNDNETLPWQINSLQTEFEAYNLGFSSYGPNDLMARIQRHQLFEGIQQTQGLAVYVFIPAHMERALGSLSVVGDWGGRSAVVEEILPNTFKYLGPYKDLHPWRYKIYQFLWRTSIVKYFKIDWPRLNKKTTSDFADIVGGLKKMYQDRFPKNRFVVLILGRPRSASLAMGLRQSFSDRQIEFIDYSQLDLSKIIGEAPEIPFDGHNNKKANAQLAKMLVQDVLFKK